MPLKIIAFTGPMLSGKTTAAELTKKLLADRGIESRIHKLAQPLYDMQDFIYTRLYKEQPVTKDRKLLISLAKHFRDTDVDTFLKVWELDLKHDKFFKSDNATILVDDLRYDNEADLITKLGGIIIHIHAPIEARKERGSMYASNDVSEAGITFSRYNAVNKGTLSDLSESINAILRVANAYNDSKH